MRYIDRTNTVGALSVKFSCVLLFCLTLTWGFGQSAPHDHDHDLDVPSSLPSMPSSLPLVQSIDDVPVSITNAQKDRARWFKASFDHDAVSALAYDDESDHLDDADLDAMRSVGWRKETTHHFNPFLRLGKSALSDPE